MNVLLIGSGGREHALAFAIRKSPLVKRLFAAPGNAGIAGIAECVDLDVSSHGAVIDFCRAQDVDFAVIGPEAPLVDGLADSLRDANIRVFGPSAAAAQLEGSKGFTKDLCARHNIPTAAYKRCHSAAEAHAYIETQPRPIVIKADGLAAGKGVIIAMNDEEAKAAIEDIFGGKFGNAGASVVIEEFLEGEEASFFVLSDGVHVLPLNSAQDHKRAGEGDTGPNTGGMGAYSPAAVMTEEMTRRVLDEIVLPTVRGMAAEGTPYQGVLFVGLMITKDGPKLIEYNARFGDPETQVLMTRLASDIVPALLATDTGALNEATVEWRPDAALTVVMAAKGYPGAYEKGTEIKGTEAARALPDVQIFHAGTEMRNGRLVASGGRVLNVTALGKNVTDAQQKAYAAVDALDWPDGFCRRDIGWRAVARESR